MKQILDDKRRSEIAAILAVGGTYAMAARYVGCDRGTIRNTTARDPQFAEQLAKAQSGAEFQFLHTIKEAGKETRYWQAAKWALEHMYPDRYRRQPRTMALEAVKDLISQLMRAALHNVEDSSVRAQIRLNFRVITGETFRKLKERPRAQNA